MSKMLILDRNFYLRLVLTKISPYIYMHVYNHKYIILRHTGIKIAIQSSLTMKSTRGVEYEDSAIHLINYEIWWD